MVRARAGRDPTPPIQTLAVANRTGSVASRPVNNESPPTRILVLNTGSSSVKFGLYPMDRDSPVIAGSAEALATPNATFTRRRDDGEPETIKLPNGTAEEVFRRIHDCLERAGLSVDAAAHRVVHGGDFFRRATRVTEEVLSRIHDLAPLAPLHNPAQLAGVRLAQSLFPNIPQFVVFDTAFHQTLPDRARRYALPDEFFTRHGIRRYGFHGISHEFVAKEAANRLGRPLNELRLLIAHLGNGCSGCAVREGRSVDTTMGFTPQEGMMMGTRSGDVDPALHLHLHQRLGWSLETITELVTREGGLAGVSGLSGDRRDLESAAESGHDGARRALELFGYRAAKSLLGICASLDRLDALVFTGGVGEHSAAARRDICGHLGMLGLKLLDARSNERHGAESNGVISTADGTTCLVVPTNEELAIARQARELLTAAITPSESDPR